MVRSTHQTCPQRTQTLLAICQELGWFVNMEISELDPKADTVAAEKQLEGTKITRKGYPHTQITPSSSKVVAAGRQCASRSTTTPPQSCSANL